MEGASGSLICLPRVADIRQTFGAAVLPSSTQHSRTTLGCRGIPMNWAIGVRCQTAPLNVIPHAVTHHAASGNLSKNQGQAPGIMKTQPHPSDREVLAGLVERVTYQNAENGFCVIRVKARSHRDLVTVVGHAATISAGEWITASGDWVNDRTHGQQFRARFLKTSEPT